MPKRIQRQRTAGWKMPENTVYVGRPTMWGNPYTLRDFLKCFREASQPEDRAEDVADAQRCIVNDFRAYAEQRAATGSAWLAPLRGKDLACWCKPGQPCHADVLLELANQ